VIGNNLPWSRPVVSEFPLADEAGVAGRVWLSWRSTTD